MGFRPVVSYLQGQAPTVTRQMAAALDGLAREGIQVSHLGAGYPHPDTFDLDAERRKEDDFFPFYYDRVLRGQMSQQGRPLPSLAPFINQAKQQYCGSEGPLPPRQAFAEVMNQALGVRTQAEHYLPQFGGTGSIDSLCSLFASAAARQSKKVVYLVDDHPYPGFTARALLDTNAEIRSIPWDDEGPVIDAMAEILRQARSEGHVVPFYYTVSIGHNPKGRNISASRMKEVLRLLSSLSRVDNNTNPLGETTFVVDDPAYLGTQFGGPSQRAMPFITYDHELGTELVITIFTLSKLNHPGKRQAFLHIPQIVKNASGETIALKDLALAVMGVRGLMHSPAAVWDVLPFLHVRQPDGSFALGNLWNIVAPKTEIYQGNRDILLAGLRELTDLGYGFREPEAGFFVNLWDLDPVRAARAPFDGAAILRMLDEDLLVVLPMAPFTASDVRARNPQAGLNGLRLSFSYTEATGKEGRRRDMQDATAKLLQVMRRR